MLLQSIELILALMISSNIIPFTNIIHIFISIPSLLSSKKFGKMLNGVGLRVVLPANF